MMKETAKNFTARLEAEGVRYDFQERQDKADWVCARFSGDNIPSIAVQFFFDADEDNAALRAFSIARVPQEKAAGMRTLLNSLMEEYRWIRLYLDSDNEVTAAIDAFITPETAGAVCYELLVRMVGIVDELYPRLMKELWS